MAWHRQGLVVGFYTLKERKNCGIDLKRCLLPKKGFESLSRRSTTTLPLKPWYRWFNIFFICLDSYLNSYVMKCSIYEFIVMKNIVKPYVRINFYEFIYESMPLNSWSCNHIRFHDHEFKSMNSIIWIIVKWQLNSCEWTSEFTYEVIVEFINLKLTDS